jgi:hypothetical protein
MRLRKVINTSPLAPTFNQFSISREMTSFHCVARDDGEGLKLGKSSKCGNELFVGIGDVNRVQVSFVNSNVPEVKGHRTFSWSQSRME